MPRIMALIGGLAILLTGGAQAGILANGTRVIYPEGSRERTLMIANTNGYPVLVQVWADDGAGDANKASAPFVILPSVFRLEPGGLQGLRILFNGSAVANDRESVYWLNLYEIPPSPPKVDPARVTLAMNTQLKIFYRPSGIHSPPEKIVKRLTFTLHRGVSGLALVCNNPTPYHASFVGLQLLDADRGYAAEQQPDMMVGPFSTRAFPLAASPADTASPMVRFTLVGDQGELQEGSAPVVDSGL